VHAAKIAFCCMNYKGLMVSLTFTIYRGEAFFLKKMLNFAYVWFLNSKIVHK